MRRDDFQEVQICPGIFRGLAGQMGKSFSQDFRLNYQKIKSDEVESN